MKDVRFNRFFKRDYNMTSDEFLKRLVKGAGNTMVLRMCIPKELDISGQIMVRRDSLIQRQFRALIVKWIILNRDVVVLRLL